MATPSPTRWVAHPNSCWAPRHKTQDSIAHTSTFATFVFYCGTEFFFSFTSNILNGRGDIAHKYHKSTTYYFHWKLIFYIRYDWIGMKWCRIRRHNTTHSCRLTQTPFRTRERRGVLLGWAQDHLFPRPEREGWRAARASPHWAAAGCSRKGSPALMPHLDGPCSGGAPNERREAIFFPFLFSFWCCLLNQLNKVTDFFLK